MMQMMKRLETIAAKKRVEARESQALTLLRMEDDRHKRLRYSNVPPAYIPHSKFDSSTSNGLTACILRWLSLHGHYATRVNTTGRMLKGSTVTDVIGRIRVMAGKWIPGSTRKGTADIHAIIHGRHCSLEIKVGRDRVSEAQQLTRADVERSGGTYFIARSFADFLDFYRKL